jgi:hypothetical protein
MNLLHFCNAMIQMQADAGHNRIPSCIMQHHSACAFQGKPSFLLCPHLKAQSANQEVYTVAHCILKNVYGREITFGYTGDSVNLLQEQLLASELVREVSHAGLYNASSFAYTAMTSVEVNDATFTSINSC